MATLGMPECIRETSSFRPCLQLLDLLIPVKMRGQCAPMTCSFYLLVRITFFTCYSMRAGCANLEELHAYKSIACLELAAARHCAAQACHPRCACPSPIRDS